jgi:hypothetical protein
MNKCVTENKDMNWKFLKPPPSGGTVSLFENTRLGMSGPLRRGKGSRAEHKKEQEDRGRCSASMQRLVSGICGQPYPVTRLYSESIRLKLPGSPVQLNHRQTHCPTHHQNHRPPPLHPHLPRYPAGGPPCSHHNHPEKEENA